MPPTPSLSLTDQPPLYNALVGLVTVNEGYPDPTVPGPYDSTYANYGLSQILVDYVAGGAAVDDAASYLMNEEIENEEILELVVGTLIPSLYGQITNKMIPAKQIQDRAYNVLSHLFYQQPYDPGS